MSGSDGTAATRVATSISQQIGAFAALLRFEDLPTQLAEQSKRLILDAIGTAYAATRFDFASRARAALESIGAGPERVIGLDARLGLRDAALLNGILIHGLDFDDTHLSGVVHVSASALPTALGVAAARHLSGRELLLGYLLGVEISARVGAAAKGGFHRAGFHPTGVAGAFGAAVAAGKLIGLSAEQLAEAQGFAMSLASGPMQFAPEGAWTKRVHPGWAAAAGITAATFAKQGFASPSFAYEGVHGLYRTHLHGADVSDLARLTDGLGDRWELDEVAVKLYPVCHFMHTCIESALELARKHELDADRIERVTCLVPADTVAVVCEPRERKIAPSSDYEAKFSLQFAIAAAIVRGRFGLAELEPDTLRDPRVLALASRVDYQPDPESGYPRFYSGELVVRTRDGREWRHREPINRGAPERPVGADDITAKFRANLEFAGADPERAQRVLEAVHSLDRCADAADFAECLAV